MNIVSRLEQWITFWLSKKVKPEGALVLNRKRIYIIPSRLGTGVIVMALALFLFGTNYQNNLILLLSFFVFSLFVFMMHVSHFNLSGLTLDVRQAKPVAVNDILRFPLLLTKEHNQTKEGLQFIWSNERKGFIDSGHKLVFLSDAETLHFEFDAKKRGAFQPKWLKITSYAPVGFFRVWSVMRTDASSWVYPKPEHGPLPVQFIDSDDAGAEEADWQVLNEYQPGDSLSRIYWRRYALNRELWVRGEHLTSQQDAPELPDALVLDFDAPSLQSYDKEQRLSVLAYWVLALQQQNKRFALKIGRQETPMSAGKEHVLEALKLLAFA